jgi:alkylation response protein AidB-like acyl-CoA dehydrogenase
MAVLESATSTGSSDEQLVSTKLDELLAAHDPKGDVVEFLGAQFDAGLAWVHFPEGEGGLGLNPKVQKLVMERIAAAGGPSPYYRNPIGYGMGAPTVVAHGSEAQKQRYLRPLFTGEEVWCQLFSEPGAGSDVASLSSRAVATATSGW